MEKDSKRHSYTASFKLHVIKYAEEHGNRPAERHFGPPPTESTIRNWRSEHDDLLKINKGKHSQLGKSAKWPELETDLLKWVQQHHENGIIISRKMIRIHAVELARERNISDFEGTESWCRRFMKRSSLDPVKRKLLMTAMGVNVTDSEASVDANSLLPGDSVKLEEACETDHDHSSADEMTIEDQVSDMVDGNLPVRIKIEQPDGEVENPGQDKTLNCSQNVPTDTVQEHSQMVCGHLGLKSVKQELSDAVREEQYQSLHNMGINEHSNTELRTAENSSNALQMNENCAHFEENASAQPESSIIISLTDESCQLESNVNMRTQDKPYISHLKKQKRKYTEDKPFKCNDCGASFTRGCHLKRHKETHTGERPYKCDVCGASFSVADYLNSHKRKHTGERPYKCDDCGASYTRVSHLKNHQRIHTGERPYKCDDCGASFTVADSLNKHKRTHTRERPCQCGASFTVHDSLDKHSCTASFKFQVIKYAEEHGNRPAERHFGPPPTEATIRRWRSQQDVLCKMNYGKYAQRGTVAKWPELETDLWKWMQENHKNGIIISRKMICIRAVELARECNIYDFKGAEEWVDCFMKRSSLDPVKRKLLMEVNTNVSEASMDANSLLPGDNIELEEACETDHDHSSAEEMTIEDQVSDMVDGNLPVRIKIEQPDGEVEHPGQDNKTLNCSQNVPRDTVQEHSQMVCGHLGLKSVKQELSDVLCEEQYQSFHNMVDMIGCNISLEMSGHSNTELRTAENSCNALQKHENYSQFSENASAQPESSIRISLTDESCQLEHNVNMRTQDTTYMSHLKKQKRKYTEDKPFKCDDCGASFTRGNHLNRHKGIHTGERPYKCDECDASYTRVSDLKIHKRRHTGEKPYKCDDCGASFIVAYSLYKHRRIHTGERPYHCDECDASFTVRDTLKKHKRTHTGERPYRCDDCGASYIQIISLKFHMRRHTGERPYKCDECDADFTIADSLKRHKRTHTRKRS